VTPAVWMVGGVALIVLLAVAYAVLSICAAAAIEKHFLAHDPDEPSPFGRRVAMLDLSDLAPPRQTYPKDEDKLRLVQPHRQMWLPPVDR
jgi:hypothetical protein